MSGLVAVVVLAAVVAASIGIVAIVRPRTGQIEVGAAAGFATALYGILLGLLLFGANTHFDNARKAASDEATAQIALVSSAIGLPVAARNQIQHDAICVMRATIADDWPAMHRGEDGSPAWRLAAVRLYSDIANAQTADPAAAGQVAPVMARAIDAGKTRDARLDQTFAQVSTPLWVILFIGASVVIVVTGLGVAEANRRRWLLAMVPMLILLAAVFYVLGAIDRPFQGVLFDVSPSAMQQAIRILEAGHLDPTVLAPCAS